MTNEIMKLHGWLTERLSELYEESQCEVSEQPKDIIEGKILSIKETLSFIDEMDRDSLQEEPVNEKKCMFTKDSFTDEDRKVLCEDCDERCEYSKK